MNAGILDSFWRAAAYCLRPSVIFLSLLPLLLMLFAAVGFGNYFFEPALDMVRNLLASTETLRSVWAWLARYGLGPAQTVIAHLLVIFTVTPLIVIGTLLAVTTLMTPLLVKLVARRRFPALQAHGSGGFVKGLLWALAASGAALLALLVSTPLWLIPPLVLVLPPLIWGWLTYRVMAFDVLSTHASTEERRQVLHEHRLPLLGMGIFCGYLGGAPGLIWLSGARAAAMFPVLVPLTVWMYALVFVFSSLWFAHYALAALHAMRARKAAEPVVVDVDAVATPEETPLRNLLEP